MVSGERDALLYTDLPPLVTELGVDFLSAVRWCFGLETYNKMEGSS